MHSSHSSAKIMPLLYGWVDKAECGKEAVESWNILVFAFAIIMLSPCKMGRQWGLGLVLKAFSLQQSITQSVSQSVREREREMLNEHDPCSQGNKEVGVNIPDSSSCLP